MKATFKSSWIKKARTEGQPDTLAMSYVVTGNKKELQQFKLSQGQLYRETEDGKPLFFKGWDMSRTIGYLPKLKNLTIVINPDTGRAVSIEA